MSSKRERQQVKLELAAQVLVPGEQWSPLDGPPAPEYVPPTWDGIHVGVRLIDAFKTLHHLPLGLTRQFASGYWPDYWHDWGDLLAQEQGGDAKDIPPPRFRPSVNEITRMERVIVWPGRYVRADDVRCIVQRVGFLRSRGLDLQFIARRLRRAPNQLRNINRAGLDEVAAGLRRDVVPIF